MKSPLQFDQGLWKELGLDDSTDYQGELKVGSARSYRDELVHVLWRQRMDLIISQYQLDHAEDDNMKVQHQTKVNEAKNTIKQMARSVKVLNELLSELETADSAG